MEGDYPRADGAALFLTRLVVCVSDGRPGLQS